MLSENEKEFLIAAIIVLIPIVFVMVPLLIDAGLFELENATKITPPKY